MGSMSPYGVGGTHRHTPEIEQNLSRAAGRPVTVSFTPTLAPMPRGILATCTARVPPRARRRRRSAPRGRPAYADEPFVHAAARGPVAADRRRARQQRRARCRSPLDERTGRVVAVASVDNLTKGTAGAAVQCANLALGLPETTGLPIVGVAP